MSFLAAILTFREGLEGALIVAIMLGYLKKVGRPDARLSVWAGALSAAALAVAFTVALQLIGAEFEDPAKGVYEGVTSLVAVAMLTYMIAWMSRQARYMKGSLEHSMKERMATGAAWGLFSIAFLSVAREGVETALFLSASAFQTSAIDTLLGGVAGLAVAIAVAYAVYVAGVRLQMRTFFKVTTVLLVVFAAAILRSAVHEFEELGWLPTIVEQVWNTETWLPADGGLGAVLQALVGYTPDPSLMQLIAYFGYLTGAIALLVRPVRKSPVSAPAPAHSSIAEAPLPVLANESTLAPIMRRDASND